MNMDIKKVIGLPSFVLKVIMNNWQPSKGDVVVVVAGCTKEEILAGVCPKMVLPREVSREGLIPLPDVDMLIRIIEKYQNCKVSCNQIHPELDGEVFDYLIWSIKLIKENGDDIVFENGFEDKLLALVNVIFELSKEEYLKKLQL